MITRWHLGADIDERIPDHSTISQLRRRKLSFRKVLRGLFEKIVCHCVEKGLVSKHLTVTNSTHVTVNASRGSRVSDRGAGESWGVLEISGCLQRRWSGRIDPPDGQVAKKVGKTDQKWTVRRVISV